MSGELKSFNVKQPKNISMRHGDTSMKLEFNPDFASKKKESLQRAQKFVDSECLRRMNPDTPRRTGMLVKSAVLGNTIGSGEIHYGNTPYARRQYYEHKEKSHWFERMKNRDKDAILAGAKKIIDSGE